MNRKNKIGLFAGLLVFVFFLLIPSDANNVLLYRTAGISILIAIWWMTEAIPLPVTALLPVALFPLLGIMDGKTVSAFYFNSYIFLFMGGFIIALSMEKWNLHKRIALFILSNIGQNPKRLVLGFMLATAFLSMWISNTAATMVMLPIGISIIKQSLDNYKESNKFTDNFALLVMLGIAYGASIGGIGTLIGTPPNVVFMQIFQMEFPNAPEISFAKWLFLGLPFVLFFLLTSWFVLAWLVFPVSADFQLADKSIIKKQRKALGPLTTPEKRQFVVFVLTALLWMFRKNIEFGDGFTIKGWSTLLNFPGADDGTVAIFMSIMLFLIPSGSKSSMLMDWKTAVKLPWGILLLFGGGFALAGGLASSGLSNWIGEKMCFLSTLSNIPTVAGISAILTYLTELNSNTATTQMALPVLAAISRSADIHPFLLMLPATLAASCAFMLPVATPPNAIVFGSGYVPISKMIKAGFILDLLSIIIITIFILLIAVPIFNIQLSGFPVGW